MKKQCAIGVDIGGSHITAGLVNIDERKMVDNSMVRMSVNSLGSEKEIIAAWASCIKNVPQFESFKDQIGISIPGPFDYEKGIALMMDQSKYDSLYRQDIRVMLSEALDVLPKQISFSNDAASFLFGEAYCGVAQGSDRTLGITLGTGLGSSAYIDGMAIDADLWRMSFKLGIAEDYICTRWFVMTFFDRTGILVTGVREIIDLTEHREVWLDIFRIFSESLADFLHLAIKMYQPEVIVIGGNISKASKYFQIQVQQRLHELGDQIPIRISTLGEKASLVGAVFSHYN